MYLNFSVDGYFTTSRRCSAAKAPAILADLCLDYSVQSHTDGNLYRSVAGHGCTNEVLGSWSLTKERQYETQQFF